MTLNVQMFLDALAKQGLNVLPYAKYVVLAYAIFVGLMVFLSAVGFAFVLYFFIKNWNPK